MLCIRSMYNIYIRRRLERAASLTLTSAGRVSSHVDGPVGSLRKKPFSARIVLVNFLDFCNRHFVSSKALQKRKYLLYVTRLYNIYPSIHTYLLNLECENVER